MVARTSLVMTAGGNTEQLKAIVAPADATNPAVVWESTPVLGVTWIFSTRIVSGVRTVTSQFAFFSPSAVVTVTVAVPFATAVTSPYSDTVSAGRAMIYAQSNNGQRDYCEIEVRQPLSSVSLDKEELVLDQGKESNLKVSLKSYLKTYYQGWRFGSAVKSTGCLFFFSFCFNYIFVFKK